MDGDLKKKKYWNTSLEIRRWIPSAKEESNSKVINTASQQDPPS